MVYGSTSAVRHIDTVSIPLPSRFILENGEFGGSEKVISVGYSYHIHNGIVLSMAISYTNSNSVLIGVGLITESGNTKARTGIWSKIKHIGNN